MLTDLFDDLITEEQFWEGGVGKEVVGHLNNILSQNLAAEVKTQAIKLYEKCVGYFKKPRSVYNRRKKTICS